jgi:polyphosphate kinase
LFNRSWYNRAGFDRVIGFRSDEEYGQLMVTVPVFEQLVDALQVKMTSVKG